MLATPELKETIRELAPAFSPEGDAQAEKVAELQEVVSNLESAQSDRLERRVHILEGALADLTAKHEKAVQSYAGTANALTDSFGTVVKRIESPKSGCVIRCRG